MRRLTFLLCCLFFALSAAAKETKPQAIVLFLTDDLGYNDTSTYGCPKVPCPNLNKLADEGLLFTDAHSTTSVCTPSRFSLLTGRYAWRQKGTGILPGDAKLILPTKDECDTLPSLMQKAGYRTAAIGKWHLGLARGNKPIDWNKPISPGPREVGFDYSFIMAATADRVPCVYVRDGSVVGLDPADPIRVTYKNVEPFEGELTGAGHPELLKPWGRSADKQHDKTIVDGISRIGHMAGGKAALWKDQDLADTITEEAVRFIRSSKGQPIFLYFCTNDIHVPRDPHRRFCGKSGLGIRGDVTVQMDDSLGRIRAALAESGYEDCLFVFTSDNGPVISDGYLDGADKDCAGHNPAAPFSGGKYTILEGGTRVPFIVHWPGHVAPGTTTDALFGQIDLARTLACLVGADVPQGALPDSENHLSTLQGKKDASNPGRTYLVEQSHRHNQLALRCGSYKLVDSPTPRLYNLADDPQEKKDIAPQHPDMVKELRARLQEIRER